jgi:hypothetical protein
MLLSTAIQTQQNSYAEIQVQIEALQEQQRQIQAYLQRLGSIESKMESAAQLMQEAIADIREACPDELPGYKQLISGFFQDNPVAFLEASVVFSEESQADDTPQGTSEDVQAEVIATDDPAGEVSQDDTTATEPDMTTIDVEAVTAVEPETAEEVETHTTFPTVDEVSKMKKADVTQWLDKFGLKYDPKAALKDLRAKLNVHLTFKNIELKENQSAA